MKLLFLISGIWLLMLMPLYGQGQIETKTLWVDGICGMCKDRIEKAVNEIAGIESASWDIDSRILTYSTKEDDFDDTQIHMAVTRVGHDTKRFNAPQKAYDALHDCCKYRNPQVIADHRPQQALKQMWVDGICGMCKDRIEAAVMELAGIDTASWDINSRQLTYLTSDEEFDDMAIHMAVTRVGHDTERFKAPQEAYNALHDCCKYRDPNVIADHRPLPSNISGSVLG